MTIGYTFYDDKNQRWGVAVEGIDQLDDLLASKPDSVYWGHE